MNVAEIEAALRQLPRRDTWEVARWLLEYLEQDGEGNHRPEIPVNTHATAPPQPIRPVKLPDYTARRRRIFGEKVLPNMVLLAREQERW